MFGLGTTELIVILILVLIIFGAGKLPKVAGDLASGIKNFRKGMSEDDKDKDKPADVPPVINQQPSQPTGSATTGAPADKTAQH